MDIHEVVQDRYGKIAAGIGNSDTEGALCCAPSTPLSSCCAAPASAPLMSSCCGSATATLEDAGLQITDTSINYADAELSELPREAIAASLGCANPLVFAELKEGETVLDLGSGGGIDVLLASRFVGDAGKVYGLDMTDEMLRLANENKARMGAGNVEFIKGYIEQIPLLANSVDVILSNCVINLSPYKEQALEEAFRVLKPGGRLRIADVVSVKEVAPEFRRNAEMWCGCLAGTITVEHFEQLLRVCGFSNISIEIVHPYTRDVIKTEFAASFEDDLSEISLDALDGAFAGALIRADK
ncbi:MAG: arsenite methyltransferase [Coriobacteriales bacterium]|jgi:SAM-dependent methyltransferase|nr:arsenite methyltransferase [Coriobacteriales bacterium]